MIFKIAFRNILRNERRSLMTVSAIAVGAIAILLFGAFMADCMVSSVSREENLEGVMTLKVTVKPTFSANAPALIGLAA